MFSVDEVDKKEQHVFYASSSLENTDGRKVRTHPVLLEKGSG